MVDAFPSYHSEAVLVTDLCLTLQSQNTPWKCVSIAREFFYVRGRTDVIALDANGNIIAFEAKLHDWRTALQQAFKNTSFANISYVVLPQDVALRAFQYSYDFHRYSVGLCAILNSGINILIEAPFQEPLQPWLSSLAVEEIEEDLESRF